MMAISQGVDARDAKVYDEFTEDELGDLYLLQCRLFPHEEDPPEESGWVTARQSASHFRGSIINALSSRATESACNELLRMARALPEQATWIRWRHQETLELVRRKDWQASRLSNIVDMLDDGSKRLIRSDDDLLDLILESLNDLQSHLTRTELPAVEELWL
jgi:hypothetical protein